VDNLKATRTVNVLNPEGLHLRAATLVVLLARRFRSDIALVKGGISADGKSTPLQLLGLGAEQGEQLALEAVGDDADEALEALADLFASGFQEEPRGERQVEPGRPPADCARGETAIE
jgi:phosphotransferase system HPr (HPr) family protein